jgi:hypothetical protein
MGRFTYLVAACPLVLWPTVCPAIAHDVLCRNGSTTFSATFRTGVQAGVGPQRNGELSTRTCQASLNWGDQRLFVASDAAQIDLDAFGVDMDGLGPIAAFQIKPSDARCCMTYQIYSLDTPPRMLRTISGGQWFRAADTDLDGRVEIWTDDAIAVDGFEGFRLMDIGFVPIVVLRFEEGRLLDVSSEFNQYFDETIIKLRTTINPERIREFRASDGKLLRSSPLAFKDQGRGLQQLRATKLKLLEIVWAYLYSGREREAWQVLADMWPPQDIKRISRAIVRMRAHGMISQVDGISNGNVSDRRMAKIYRGSQVKPAQPIMVRCYPRCGQRSGDAELRVNLVIDSAGKVRSAGPIGTSADETITRTAEEWKFIPAFRNGRSVASRLKGAISLRQ